MNSEDKLIITAEIATGAQCDLKHDDDEEHPAVDAIVIPMGHEESENIYVQENEAVILICKDCAEGLQSKEWVLFYCFNCNSSQWLYLPLAKKSKSCYHKINWLKECPKCK